MHKLKLHPLLKGERPPERYGVSKILGYGRNGHVSLTIVGASALEAEENPRKRVVG